ncbi:hypothetical protein F9L16_16095 [Agarivorans sp. B2Z047]|uniref:hypothetical protein n=1 Tax=Agarivorans sp. B2Z047 TaxID=2652721 RepID=UPI00128CF5EC|nr:hypothetical protein [Agarivorans sp. B2Z047]MPW30508.1 hypothetical protein [Agarivorans sp. B2Z047]UQN42271.1 hypothetical protein LQZ07_21250 [Agarivorans sp. B2Z047]
MNVIENNTLAVIVPQIQLQLGYQVVELGHSYFTTQSLVSIEDFHHLADLMEGNIEGPLSSRFSQEYMALAVLGAIHYWQQSKQLEPDDLNTAKHLSTKLGDYLNSLSQKRKESENLSPPAPDQANIGEYYCLFEFADGWQIKVGKCSSKQAFGIYFVCPLVCDVEPPLAYMLQQINAHTQALSIAPLNEAEVKPRLRQVLSNWLAQFSLQHPQALQSYTEWEFEELSLTEQALCEVYCQAQSLKEALI